MMSREELLKKLDDVANTLDTSELDLVITYAHFRQYRRKARRGNKTSNQNQTEEHKA